MRGRAPPSSGASYPAGPAAGGEKTEFELIYYGTTSERCGKPGLWFTRVISEDQELAPLFGQCSIAADAPGNMGLPMLNGYPIAV